MGIEDVVAGKRDQIIRLVTEHGGANVRVFGSVARGAAGPESDIDLLVDGLEDAPWGGGRLLVELDDCSAARSTWRPLVTFTGHSASACCAKQRSSER